MILTAARRAVRAEWGPLAGAIRAGLVRRKAAALSVTIAAVCLIVLCQYLQNQSWGRGPVEYLGYVQTSQPWWVSLLRTPLSLFVPAPDLPVWGGLLQVFVVFAVCECALGWRRTLLVAYVATLAGTTYARIGVALGPGGLLGLPASTADIHDTGPSAAVVGLSVYVCWRYRAWLTGTAVVGSMLWEIYAKPNLAGREHLVAIMAIAVVCAVRTYRERRRRLVPAPTAGKAGEKATEGAARLAPQGREGPAPQGREGPAPLRALGERRTPRERPAPQKPREPREPQAAQAAQAAQAPEASRTPWEQRRRVVRTTGSANSPRGHGSGKPPSQSWALRRSRFHRAS
ncbi:hypothetical protein [Streptomyces zagrosensis]|uniref:Uncharacterized protein n=1 Tax=Streptomyces zagrosensis TaxID=1042984 RepID=A0A7W9Q4D3_9ACTN|nr:hypothetical protein [Streptomyces zagrosensis]MBB5933398.1 hypothetical protein [Streptomyces zagrosensis]